jgi:hypothetical protein
VTSFDDSNKDLYLKLITSRIFRDFGYATWVEVNYFVHTYGMKYTRPEVTDLDVVGLAFDGDLTMRSIIAECKSPEPGASEDLLKLLGAMTLFPTCRGYLVKERIAENAREVACQQSVGCLDQEEALQLINHLEPDAKAKLDGEMQGYTAWMEVIGSLRDDKPLQSALRYVRRDFWINKAWENVHNLLFLSRNVLVPYLDPDNQNHCAFMLELCRLFNISFLKLCNTVMISRLSQLEREIEIQAFGGPKSRRERERLYDEIARALPPKKQMPNPLNPPYMAQLKEVANYYIMSPIEASKTPMAIQQILFQNYLHVNNMYYDTVNLCFPEVTIKLAKDSSELLVNEESGKGKKFLTSFLSI